MLTLNCERILRRMEVGAEVRMVCQFLPGDSTGTDHFLFYATPTTPCPCLRSILVSVPNSKQADLFSIFTACFSYTLNHT